MIGGGGPLVNVKLPSFNVKCSQKLVNLGNLFLSKILLPKLLTYCFFLRMSAYILFSFLHVSCLLQILHLIEFEKNVQTARFRTCFRYGKIDVPIVFALAHVVHSKILPQICLPQIFYISCFPRRHPKGWKSAYSMYAAMLIYIYMCVCNIYMIIYVIDVYNICILGEVC